MFWHLPIDRVNTAEEPTPDGPKDLHDNSKEGDRES
jgi:hypothetical protein